MSRCEAAKVSSPAKAGDPLRRDVAAVIASGTALIQSHRTGVSSSVLPA